MKLTPAPNIVLAFIGYVLAALALQYAKEWHIDVPDELAQNLPAATGLAIAHAWDMATGSNKPVVQQFCELKEKEAAKAEAEENKKTE